MFVYVLCVCLCVCVFVYVVCVCVCVCVFVYVERESVGVGVFVYVDGVCGGVRLIVNAYCKSVAHVMTHYPSINAGGRSETTHHSLRYLACRLNGARVPHHWP